MPQGEGRGAEAGGDLAGMAGSLVFSGIMFVAQGQTPLLGRDHLLHRGEGGGPGGVTPGDPRPLQGVHHDLLRCKIQYLAIIYEHKF